LKGWEICFVGKTASSAGFQMGKNHMIKRNKNQLQEVPNAPVAKTVPEERVRWYSGEEKRIKFNFLMNYGTKILVYQAPSP